MTPSGDDLTNGEIGRSLTRLEQAVTGLTVDMKTGFTDVQNRMELMRSEFVHRTEYDERKAAVNREIVLIRTDQNASEQELNGRINMLEARVESRRPQWTAVGSLVVAVVALAAAFIPALAR